MPLELGHIFCSLRLNYTNAMARMNFTFNGDRMHFRTLFTAAIVIVGSVGFAHSSAALTTSALAADASQGQTEITGRRGPDLQAPLVALETDTDGRPLLKVEELDRLELRVAAYSGHLDTAIGQLPLPIGSRIDPGDGTFTWLLGPGFIGTYELVFDTWQGTRAVRVVVYPQGMLSRPQVIIDTPTEYSENSGAFIVAGWAVDPKATVGTGIDVIHVWAYPATGGAPMFLGATKLDGERPDVQAIYGDRARYSGYGLIANALPPGTYDLAAFGWSMELQDFLPATTRRITVR